jgi:hypothetical protein
MRLDTRMRVVGNMLVIAGYFVVLHVDMMGGLIMHITACAISYPFYVRTRSWDVVIRISFVIGISASKLLAVSSA